MNVINLDVCLDFVMISNRMNRGADQHGPIV